MQIETITEELQKNKKDPLIYGPLVKLFHKEKKPLGIKTVSQLLGLSYDITKQRLRKMELAGFLKRGRRGIYSIPQYLEKFELLERPVGKSLIVNGGLRRINKAIRLQIYCSALTKVCKDKFCFAKQIDKDTLLLRKSNQFLGRRMYPLKALATAVILSSDVFLDNLPPSLDRKNKRIEVKFYPDEWGVELQDALGSENIKEGELGKELSKYGKTKKGSRGDTIKTDLIFEFGGREAYIELTQTKKAKKNSRSDIRAMTIQARLYYGIKSFQKQKIQMFIVMDNEWSDVKWLLNEIDFLKENGVELLFTDFKNKWVKSISKQIIEKLQDRANSL